MKDKNKIFISNLLVVFMVMLIPTLANAKSLKHVVKDIEKNMGSAVVREASTFTEKYGEPWCEKKGVINSQRIDMNKDGKKELLVAYIANGKSTFGGEKSKKLCLSVYSSRGKKCDTIVLSNGFDDSLALDIKVSLHKYRGKNYICFQEMYYGQGTRGRWWILSINRQNKIIREEALIDPGYSDGVGLYMYAASTLAKDLEKDSSYNVKGKAIFRHEDHGLQYGKMYSRVMAKKLSKYGIKTGIAKYETYKGFKTKFIKIKPTKSKQLCHISSDVETMSNGYDKHTYKIVP